MARTEWERKLTNRIVEVGYAIPETFPLDEPPEWNAPRLIKLLGVHRSLPSITVKPRAIFAAEVIAPLSEEPEEILRTRPSLRRYFDKRDFEEAKDSRKKSMENEPSRYRGCICMTPTSPAEIPFEENIWVHSLHPHMLIQDFKNTVVPYRRHGEAYKLTVKGLPKGMVDGALELSRSGDGVDNFIRAVGSTLLMEHEAWLEILFNDPDKEGLPFRVFPVTGVRQTQTGNWTRDPGRPDGPAFWALTQNERSNHPIETDPERLVRVHLPEEYPSRVLTEVIQGLVEADSISRQ